MRARLAKTVTTSEMINIVHNIVLNYRKIDIQDSISRTSPLARRILGMSKLSLKWMARISNYVNKCERQAII